MQAAEKLVLAEGSKMVMVGAQSAAAQGVYGLVVNLGSLVVRTAFQPFEEAAFTAFSTSGGENPLRCLVLFVGRQHVLDGGQCCRSVTEIPTSCAFSLMASELFVASSSARHS